MVMVEGALRLLPPPPPREEEREEEEGLRFLFLLWSLRDAFFWFCLPACLLPSL